MQAPIAPKALRSGDWDRGRTTAASAPAHPRMTNAGTSPARWYPKPLFCTKYERNIVATSAVISHNAWRARPETNHKAAPKAAAIVSHQNMFTRMPAAEATRRETGRGAG